MAMPVVEIRPVRMRVLDRAMDVLVAVPDRPRQTRMLVIVVAVVVPMRMLVLHGRM